MERVTYHQLARRELNEAAQYYESESPGHVTVAGKPSDDLPPGTLNCIFKQAGWKKGSN